MILKIGTRKSRLAIRQAELVIEEITKHFSDIECIIIPIITTGDRIKNKNLYDIGGKALFLKEIEEQLKKGDIDIAVHSYKDVPGVTDPELIIAAVLEREDESEVLISSKYKKIEDLPLGATVGTSSVRRKAFLKLIRPDLQIMPFRGNVDSRLKKVLSEVVHATLLTAAGLKRINLYDEAYCSLIDKSKIIPAPCQGIIAVQITENANKFIRNICKKINNIPTYNITKTERAFVEYLKADCDKPAAANAFYENEKIKANFMFENNEKLYFYSEIGDIIDAKNIGIRAAQKLINT